MISINKPKCTSPVGELACQKAAGGLRMVVCFFCLLLGAFLPLLLVPTGIYIAMVVFNKPLK